MKAHIIENGIVVNTIKVESLDFMPNLIDGSDGGIGWEYINGELIEPTPIIEVPQTITKLQAMKQLKAIDKWNALKVVLASNEDVNDEWVLSDNLNRTYPLVLGMAQALDISDEELDTLFVEASKL